MPQQLSDDLLHLRTRHTNLMVPFSKYITATEFPEQNTELLNTIVSLNYRNMYVVNKDELTGPEIYEEENGVHTADFLVLRCDIVEPFVMIGVTPDCSLFLVTDSRKYSEIITIYPKQLNEYIGLLMHDQYPGIIPEIKAVTLRVDNGEPCYTILMEFLEDNQVRFLLGDECFTKLIDWYDPLGLNDWNGKDAVDHPEEFRDADGGLAETLNIPYINIDGGAADIFKYIFRDAKSDQDVIEIRKLAMKGKILYGSGEIKIT